jgi:hypothetical protein
VSTNTLKGQVRGGDPAPGASPTGAGESLYVVMQTFVRQPGFGKLLTKGKIGDLSMGVRGGIDADRINRSMLGPLYGTLAVGGPNYSVTSAAPAWAEIDSTRLAGAMVCSGRPVRIDISAGATKGTTQSIQISVAMDGTEVTGVSDGMMWIDATGDQFLTGWHVMTPTPGVHRFAMVADVVVAGGSGALLYAGSTDIVQMSVTEL